MDQLRSLRVKFQSGSISLEIYNQERIRIINFLTNTVAPNEAPKAEYDEDAFSKPFNDGSQVVLQVTEISKVSNLPEGWYMGADGRHTYHMQTRMDGTAYNDPRCFPGVKLHKI